MIRKKFLMALSVSALLLGGCIDSSTGAAAKADMESGDAHKTEAKHKVEKKAEAPAPKAEEKKVEKAEAPAPKAEESKPAEEAPAPKVEESKPAEEAPAPKAEESKPTEEASAPKASADVNTAACAGCHGANFEKKAMGVSKIVKDLKKEEIIEALKGYKDGSYGGSMKALMKGQVASLDDAKIEAIANKFGK
jgi:cytochrome c553